MAGRHGKEGKVKVELDQEAETLFAMVMRLGGGESAYSDHTKAQIWAECRKNTELRNEAILYLYGSSERAKLNLERLTQTIIRIFFTNREGKVTL